MYELYLTPKIAHFSNNHSCVLSQLLYYWVKDQFLLDTFLDLDLDLDLDLLLKICFSWCLAAAI